MQKELYDEAQKRLTFLLQFSTVEQSKRDQWEALLQWLQTMHPETVFPAMEATEEEQEEEEELLRQYIQDKAKDNAAFGEKLLNNLREGTLEQQVTALEQLAFVDLQDAGQAVKLWVVEKPRHPYIQFKALQTLRHMGERGFIELPKNGAAVFVEIEETPLCPEDFPTQIQDMIRRVGEISEVDQPDFVYFASQTWQEFLAYAYGTSIYSDLLKLEEGAVDVWASALHTVLQERLFGSANREELLDTYGIVDSMKLQWKRAHITLQTYMNQMNPERS
ncbi:hypothetical protein [Paenibacillus sp. SI8]|uniref:hypothetical protein n=1 Tax=unclassified Paenibacillus TaxID=185978 RepID=UPI0034658E8C